MGIIVGIFFLIMISVAIFGIIDLEKQIKKNDTSSSK
jgi:hypothetical protein